MNLLYFFVIFEYLIYDANMSSFHLKILFQSKTILKQKLSHSSSLKWRWALSVYQFLFISATCLTVQPHCMLPKWTMNVLRLTDKFCHCSTVLSLLIVAVCFSHSKGILVSTDPNITFHTYVEQRAGTRSCEHQEGLVCTTLIFAEYDPDLRQSTVSAGYLIFTNHNTPMVPELKSRRLVASTSTADAFIMADVITNALTTTHSAALCSVTVAEVAAAIWQAARVASECADTEDPVCFPFFKIRVCNSSWS